MPKVVFGESYKKVGNVFIEASLVGFASIILYIIVFALLSLSKPIKDKTMLHITLSSFLFGMIFHVASEYSGINVWYAKDYNKLIPKQD